MVNRVILLVLDSVGIGELPDSKMYGDEGSNTLGNISEKIGGAKTSQFTENGSWKYRRDQRHRKR